MLRQQLLVQRDQFIAGPQAMAAEAALTRHLLNTVARLDPACLGVYWAFPSEFNASRALAADPRFDQLAKALPFARRIPRQMDYLRWDGAAPAAKDECGIPCGSGSPVVPDVVLVPCVGHTADGFRLGYGGGYFDRWLAAHPQVTAIGVSWSVGLMDAGAYRVQAHDVPMMLVVTEAGVA